MVPSQQPSPTEVGAEGGSPLFVVRAVRGTRAASVNDSNKNNEDHGIKGDESSLEWKSPGCPGDLHGMERRPSISSQSGSGVGEVEDESDYGYRYESAWERMERRRRRVDEELRSGLAVVRDLRSFATLDVLLHEELLLLSPSSSGELQKEDCGAVEPELPSLPVDVVMIMSQFYGKMSESDVEDVDCDAESSARIGIEGNYHTDSEPRPSKHGFEEFLSIGACNDFRGRDVDSVSVAEGRGVMQDLQKQFIAEKFSRYLVSLLQLPPAVSSRAFADFLSFDPALQQSRTQSVLKVSTDGLTKDKYGYSEAFYKMIIPCGGEKQKDGTVMSIEIMSNENESACSTLNQRNFADYIFQGDVDEMLIPIQRRESYAHTERLPAGWWLVWQFRVQTSGPPLEFTVSVQDQDQDHEHDHSNDPEDETRKSDDSEGTEVDRKATTTHPSSETCVVEESVGETTDVVRGSYRCQPTLLIGNRDHHHRDGDRGKEGSSGVEDFPSSQMKCTLKFSNQSSLFRGAQLQLAVQCVPHEAFKAACKAAEDQLEADRRRDKAPLLRQILHSSESDPVSLRVEPYVPSLVILDDNQNNDDDEEEEEREEEEEEQEERGMSSSLSVVSTSAYDSILASSEGNACGVGQSEEPKESNARHSRSSSATNESMTQIVECKMLTLRKEVALLRSEKVRDKAEISKLHSNTDELHRRVDFMEAEKHVWTVTKKETQDELSKTRQLLEDERKKYTGCSEELDVSRKEVEGLKCELEVLQSQIPSQEEVERAKQELMEAKVEALKAHDMIKLLKRQIAGLKDENHELSDELRDHRNISNDMLLNARAEADEARMMQRILEGKVQEMESLLITRSSLEGNSSECIREISLDGQDVDASKQGNKSSPMRKTSAAASSAKKKKKESNSVGAETVSSVDDDTFIHPNEKINAQLVGLKERHTKLVSIWKRDPQNKKNAELIRKIEGAIAAIKDSATKQDGST